MRAFYSVIQTGFTPAKGTPVQARPPVLRCDKAPQALARILGPGLRLGTGAWPSWTFLLSDISR
jgi:hypothetical protein